ncbi:MAG: selenium-dependent molybdenum cofactor biosynthesis protein YqeB [Pygmaiobacter sp.]
MLIFIKGAGDLATGVAWRLRRCGFDVVMTETAQPTTVRCTVAFSRAVYDGTATVEGVCARLAQNADDTASILHAGEIAVLVDPDASAIAVLHPPVVIDAVLAKHNLGTKITDAPVVVALGPGFSAGDDCHAVIETKRGHFLGSVIYEGSAIANTGVPGEIGGYTSERIIRACREGSFTAVAQIGQLVKKDALVATVEGEPVYASIDGVVRGMLPTGTPVHKGMKSGDIDPRGIVEYCDSISDKARAIAGGALEAVLHLTGLVGGAK